MTPVHTLRQRRRGPSQVFATLDESESEDGPETAGTLDFLSLQCASSDELL